MNRRFMTSCHRLSVNPHPERADSKGDDTAADTENEFALITENMQEGFLVVDKKEIVLSHNRSISTLFDVDESVDGNMC